MLRTNSKETKRRVREWIKNNFDFSNYEGYEEEPKTEEEILQFIAHTSFKELGFEVEKGFSSFQAMFKNWCCGLPACLDTASFLCAGSAVDLVGDILNQTKQERAKYSETEAEDLMLYLIFKEVSNYLYKEEK